MPHSSHPGSHKQTEKGLTGFLAKLDTSHVMVLVGLLFFLDVAIPDPIPFIDEIVLGSLAILLARWQSRRANKADQDPGAGFEPGAYRKPPSKNVTNTAR